MERSIPFDCRPALQVPLATRRACSIGQRLINAKEPPAPFPARRPRSTLAANAYLISATSLRRSAQPAPLRRWSALRRRSGPATPRSLATPAASRPHPAPPPPRPAEPRQLPLLPPPHKRLRIKVVQVSYTTFARWLASPRLARPAHTPAAPAPHALRGLCGLCSSAASCKYAATSRDVRCSDDSFFGRANLVARGK